MLCKNLTVPSSNLSEEVEKKPSHYYQIQVDNDNIEQSKQEYMHVVIEANNCNPAIGGILEGGDKKPLKMLINWKNIQSI